MRSIIFLFLVTGIIVVLAGVLGSSRFQAKIPLSLGSEPKKEIKVGEKVISVTLADNEAERKNGLSGKTSLGADSGMLFIFDKKDIYPSFWMKEMLIPIDIIWVNDAKVVKIDKALQPPDKDIPEGHLTLYYPEKPIDYVLEVNAGFSDNNNVTLGTEVDLSGI